jgi:hypothetical protein
MTTSTEISEHGITEAVSPEHGEKAPVVAEGLGEHKPGESLGEWLRNDLAQTMEDFHIGKAHKKEA